MGGASCTDSVYERSWMQNEPRTTVCMAAPWVLVYRSLAWCCLESSRQTSRSISLQQQVVTHHSLNHKKVVIGSFNQSILRANLCCDRAL